MSEAVLDGTPVVLEQRDWLELERAHVRRMREWTVPHRLRRSHGEKHPVLDFLFTYYSYRPAHLERWQPGPGVVLTGPEAARFLERKGYRRAGDHRDGVLLDPTGFTPARAETARFVLGLMEATASRAPRLNCFGLHEWAMVYRQSPEELRHNQLPLRLGPAGTDRVVDSLEVRCGHYDAFRFFTEPAREHNTLRPTADNRLETEQPGCLHSGMDLFKWSYKLDPWVPAELLGDTFALAVDIRTLDMRASPYDLSGFGHDPVRIETAQGRAEYARAQADFARRAAPLRARLIDHCRRLVTR